MDYIAPTVRDLEVDLESGCTVSGDDLSEETFLGVKKQAKTMLAKICSRFIDGSINNENKISLCGNVSNNDGLSGENAIVQESKDIEGKKVAKEKRKKSSNKKAPKPPKPPRGPSLDSADLKLIKEISELAMLKRARIERMKALKKMKASKQSSSNSNMFATVFTVLFCLVILFQGMSSSGTPVRFQGSPLSSGAIEGGLISVQFSGNPSASEPNAPGFGSVDLVEQVTGSDPQEKLNIATG
ncbi:Transmembrane protein [Melia azedarach]|uniref:Transmembrane protein n=1 Tax=Melia azedarach TaxID=155640 RepID=A0ACC1YEY8_MELAZ|nr:Transmembrane protein [Melia azedarach]